MRPSSLIVLIPPSCVTKYGKKSTSGYSFCKSINILMLLIASSHKRTLPNLPVSKYFLIHTALFPEGDPPKLPARCTWTLSMSTPYFLNVSKNNSLLSKSLLAVSIITLLSPAFLNIAFSLASIGSIGMLSLLNFSAFLNSPKSKLSPSCSLYVLNSWLFKLRISRPSLTTLIIFSLLWSLVTAAAVTINAAANALFFVKVIHWIVTNKFKIFAVFIFSWYFPWTKFSKIGHIDSVLCTTMSYI